MTKEEIVVLLFAAEQSRAKCCWKIGQVAAKTLSLVGVSSEYWDEYSQRR